MNVLSYNQVTVGTTATKVLDADTSHKTVVTLVNAGSPQMYLGDSSVTTSNGFILYAGAESVTLTLPPGSSLYVVAASAGNILSYFATA